MGMYRELNN